MEPTPEHREYTNGELTIVWKPELCIHCGFCARGLPDVFRPKVKPWITVTAAATDLLATQVNQCPSGALSFYMNTKSTDMQNDEFKINEAASRFEMQVQGQTAFIDYVQKGDVISLTHTEVPKNLEGNGYGKNIVERTLNYINDNNLKVAPLCSFVSAYISRNPKWDQIVANG